MGKYGHVLTALVIRAGVQCIDDERNAPEILVEGNHLLCDLPGLSLPWSPDNHLLCRARSDLRFSTSRRPCACDHGFDECCVLSGAGLCRRVAAVPREARLVPLPLPALPEVHHQAVRSSLRGRAPRRRRRVRREPAAHPGARVAGLRASWSGGLVGGVQRRDGASSVRCVKAAPTRGSDTAGCAGALTDAGCVCRTSSATVASTGSGLASGASSSPSPAPSR